MVRRTHGRKIQSLDDQLWRCFRYRHGCWQLGSKRIFQRTRRPLVLALGKKTPAHLPTITNFHQKRSRSPSFHPNIRRYVLVIPLSSQCSMLRTVLHVVKLHNEPQPDQKSWVLGYRWRGHCWRLPYVNKNSFQDKRWSDDRSNLHSIQSAEHPNWKWLRWGLEGKILATGKTRKSPFGHGIQYSDVFQILKLMQVVLSFDCHCRKLLNLNRCSMVRVRDSNPRPSFWMGCANRGSFKTNQLLYFAERRKFPGRNHVFGLRLLQAKVIKSFVGHWGSKPLESHSRSTLHLH